MSEPRFVAYESGGATEWMIARGPTAGPQILILQPLFEEMNRCRAILAGVQRGLAAAGVGSWLVDLPGTGESARALETVRFRDWRSAVSDAAAVVAAAGAPLAVGAVRGGCLLDDAIEAPRWRLSPVAGASLVRDLTRAIPGGDRAPFGGYPASERLIQTLADAEPLGGARTVRLNDAGDADHRIAAAPPWRRGEPAADAPLAAAMTADLVAWLGR